MSIAVLIQQICIIFLMIAVGFAAQKAHVLTDENSKVLSDVLMKIALPFTILSSTDITGGRETVSLMLIGFLLLLAFYCVTAAISQGLAHVLHFAPAKRVVFVVLSVLPNSAFIGIPILSALLGPEGVVFAGAGIMAYNVFFFTYGMALFQKGARFSPRSLLTPANFATVAMIVMLVAGLRLPETVQVFVNGMGAVTTPLAMLIIGSMLAGSDLLSVFKNKFFYGLTLLRCFVYPLAFALLLCFLPLDRGLCIALVALCACASGTLAAVVARQTDTEPMLASQGVAHTTLFLIVSMPVVMALAQRLFF